MPQLEVLGVNTGLDRSRLPLVLGLGAIALLLLFRRPAGASSPAGAGGLDAAGAAEFYRTSAAAATDMRQLAAATQIRLRELDIQARGQELAFADSPSALASCWSQSQWNQLLPADRKLIRAQAKRSGSLITAGPNGSVCVTPSRRGIEGDLQTVSKARSGLLSSSSSAIGTAAQQVQRPGIVDIISDYLGYRTAQR